MKWKIAFVSAMLALAATSVHSPLAHALKPSPAQQACENRGYIWSASKGCADKACRDPILGNGLPGDNQSITQPGGKKVSLFCDGFTGKWTLLAIQTQPPAGFVAPLPTQNAPPLQQTPPGPAAPLPQGGAERR